LKIGKNKLFRSLIFFQVFFKKLIKDFFLFFFVLNEKHARKLKFKNKQVKKKIYISFIFSVVCDKETEKFFDVLLLFFNRFSV
jgi:hypothetical protein